MVPPELNHSGIESLNHRIIESLKALYAPTFAVNYAPSRIAFNDPIPDDSMILISVVRLELNFHHADWL